MKEDENLAARRAGPKRSEASRLAVLNATVVELNEHGWRSFSVERVAKRARASKQTIYRWWPRPAMMVVEAGIARLPDPRPNNPAGTPEEEIASLLSPLLADIRRGDGAHVWRGVLLAAADDADASDVFRDWVQTSLRQPLRHILAGQAAKGLIRRDWDLDFAVELLLGPLWQRLLGMRGPAPERYALRLAEALMATMRGNAGP